MHKFKWFVAGVMFITIVSVLVGCGSKTDSESGSNTGAGSNSKNTVENIMTATGAKEIATDAATGIKEIATDAATGAKDMMETAKDGIKEMATEVSSAFSK